MVINRVGPLSCAKITGTLYAILGLIIGACISLFAMAGSMASWLSLFAMTDSMPSERAGGAMSGALIGVGAIIVLPLFYGAMGFIAMLIGAWLYNVAAGIVGGVEIDVR